MSHDELSKIVAKVQAAFDRAELKWPPTQIAPTPLSALIDALPLASIELHDLTTTVIYRNLIERGLEPGPLAPNADRLAGFMFAANDMGRLYVNRNDPVPRRRFTAAHELGHFLLHLPEHPSADQPTLIADSHDAATVREDEQFALAVMEREANRFAAELLMPSNLVRRLFTHYSRQFGSTPRFIEHHLAADLLVSREAIRWRLVSLDLCRPPPADERLSRAEKRARDTNDK